MSGRLLQLAWRNLWRNRRRTLITIAGVALGYVLLLTLASLQEGMRQSMIENGTRLSLSHIQIHAPGYYPDRPIHEVLGGRAGTDVNALLAAITADPRVRAAAPRVYGYGLVSSAEYSAGAEILGVVPDQEQQITTLHTRMIRGSYLTEQLPRGVIVGEKLANTIGVRVGSEVVLLTQAADGSMGNGLYNIIGIFRTGLEVMDRGMLLMSLSSLQELLSLKSDRIHEVGILLPSAVKATVVAAALESRVGEILPVRVRAWPELVPELAGYVRLSRNVNSVVFFFVFLVASVGVMNTLLMTVFERTRELGVLMALGTRPVQIIGLILAEAGSLVGVSMVLGGGIGMPLLWYLQVHGLDLRHFMGEVSLAGAVIDPIWYGRSDFFVYRQSALGLVVTALVSALYPALRAVRVRPVEAIHKV